MVRLGRATHPIPRPSASGIVHFGLGAFHRAHQAVHTEDAMAATGDDRWGICATGQRSGTTAELLARQDGLYTLLTGGEARVIGALREVLPPGERAWARVADPAVRVVTLTVTEKAYRADAPAISRLVYGMRLRMAADAGPLTVVSCDNLPGNGRLLAGLVTGACDGDARLRSWIEDNVRFPGTMVDRIVPATTPDDVARATRLIGAEDLAPVVTEPFSQWVIEDDFAAGRPAWELAGALFVPDARPYERMKLRLLNGSHSALAYLGGLAGRELVARAVGEPVLGELVRRLMAEDLAPTLAGLDGFDLAAYQASLLARFGNPGVRHRLAQIATDGTQKLPQRLLDPARERLAAGGDARWIALAVAGWARYASAGRADDGAPLDLDDPLADRLSGATPASC